jgi:hypothetical protein
MFAELTSPRESPIHVGASVPVGWALQSVLKVCFARQALLERTRAVPLRLPLSIPKCSSLDR